MTIAGGRAFGPRYEVAVSGTLGPAIRAWFADLGLSQRPQTTVFRMELSADQGPEDISAMLRAKGLVMLSARKLTTRADSVDLTPRSTPAHDEGQEDS